MRCIVLSGGQVENTKWIGEIIKTDDVIICADSGAKYALALNLKPQVIVGDFDSIDQKDLEKLREQGTTIKEHPTDKENTDTALALKEALTYNPQEILLIGALGTRFDHSLANIHLLRMALDHGVQATVANETNKITLISPENPYIIQGEAGNEFSLLPLTTEVTGVSVQGAKWELENATFMIGNPYGVSNQLSSNTGKISITSGLLLLIKIEKESL